MIVFGFKLLIYHYTSYSFHFLQYLKAILDEGVFSRDFGTMQESVKLEDATGKMAVKSNLLFGVE